MLALNSYGLSRSNNQHHHHHQQHVALPPISTSCGGGLPAVREIRSLSKLDMIPTQVHPLYRTTTGYDYGRYMDFRDTALSCPKYAKAVGFTKDFIAGPFTDTSLTSIDKSKQRAESWEKKVLERTKQMQIKYEELQLQLETKKQLRRKEREVRRKEMQSRHHAALLIQTHIRGFLARKAMQRVRYHRHTLAALKIQQVCRSYAEIRRAKAELRARKFALLDVFAIKMQHAGRNYILRADAKRELLQLKENSRQQRIQAEQTAQILREHAAKEIQRIIRGHITRRTVQRQYSSMSISNSDKDDIREYAVRSGKTRSANIRRSMMTMRRKRDKSVHRLSLLNGPKN